MKIASGFFLRKREEDGDNLKGHCQIWELITCMIIMKL